MLEQSSYYLSPGAEEAFRQYLSRRMRGPRFANARSVRNELGTDQAPARAPGGH